MNLFTNAGVGRVIGLAIRATSLLLFSSDLSWGSDSPTVQLDISYGPKQWQKLDIYSPSVTSALPNPAVVFIHGGGWVSGKKGDFQGLAGIAVQVGMVAISIDYRLATGEPERRWPGQLKDVETAVGWVRQHAIKLHVDARRICAFGVSAGGQLAVFLAALQELPSSRIDCAVDDSGPVDLTTPYYLPPASKLFAASTGPLLKDAERLASPLFFVGPHTAPIYVAHGAEDALVPPEQASKLYEKLRSHGVVSKLSFYPGGHAWQGLPRPYWLALIHEEFDFIQRVTADVTR